MATETKEVYHEVVNVKQIHPNSYNPNEMTDFQRKALRLSMSSGDKQTILLRPCACSAMKDSHFEIVDGEQRWSDARDNNVEKLHALIVDEEEQEAMVDTLRMNKIKGEPNPMKLLGVIKTLQEKYAMTTDQISLQSGFTVPELKIAMNRAKQQPKKKDVPPSKMQQIIIVCTEEEKNFITEHMNAFQAKSKKEFQRNGTLLAEMLK